MNDADRQTVLLTGATGYIGGRLAPKLLAAGYRVRCIVREARKVDSRSWSGNASVEIIVSDLEDEQRLMQAMRGCTAAYYFVHSMMAAGAQYRQRDRELAATFARAAAAAGVSRIIYLGGLGENDESLSEHLSSRREVESALASTGVPVTVLRAAMIIGSGSASFEILRYLVERLPIMVTPRWVKTESQPIAVRDVLHYLVACLKSPASIGQTLDIGGPDILQYRQLMDMMSDALGLRRRLVIPVPVLTPRLSSLWIHLVTPISHRIARPLAEGLRNRVVCRNDDARRLMPHECISVQRAIKLALGKTESGETETTWFDAGTLPGDPDWAGGKVFEDRRSTPVSAGPAEVFSAVSCIGGDNGYFAADGLWRLRGFMDRLAGGPGLRRGRRCPKKLAFGDAVDFWRVTGIDEGKRLELRAEMRLPGVATLTFEVTPTPNGSILTQTARFKPRGLSGIAYWYAVAPLHGIVFQGMMRGIRRKAEARATAGTSPQRPEPPMIRKGFAP